MQAVSIKIITGFFGSSGGRNSIQSLSQLSRKKPRPALQTDTSQATALKIDLGSINGAHSDTGEKPDLKSCFVDTIHKCCLMVIIALL